MDITAMIENMNAVWEQAAGPAGMWVLGSMTLLWLVSLPLRDASIADLYWGFGYCMVAALGLHALEQPLFRHWVLVALVVIWGMRLSLYLAIRNIGHGEDFRYRAFRRHWGDKYPFVSFLQTFMLQGCLVLIISLPVQAGLVSTAPGFGLVSILGCVVWGIGFFFEAVGDAQLLAFKKDPTNKGKIMRTGLWRYTRHPNYFGDTCIWYGVYLVACGGGGAWWTLPGPFLMMFFLLRVSGVPMLEHTMSKRPGYDDYVAPTSVFFPLPPKKVTQ